ncbi:MAG: hypothetical protein JWO86_2614 [Myxococcaceae bacterium]|nr:hypothetical protein [Myxococcaceae bacterium]
MSSKRSRALVVLAMIALPGVACQAIVGIHDHDFTVPAAEASAVDAFVEASAEAAPARCPVGNVPPTKPDRPDDSVMRSFTFAVSRTSLRGTDATGAAVGFDIDDVCTCDPRDDSVHAGGLSCGLPAAPYRAGACDEDGGIDDALGGALVQVEKFASVFGFPSADEAVNLDIGCGRHTVLYTLEGYNGLADDPVVTVTGYQTVGIHELADGGADGDGGFAGDASACPPYDGGAPYPPQFDGNDRWSVATDSTSVHTVFGYVKDFRLVVDGRASTNGVQDTVLAVRFYSKVVAIVTPVLVARLVPLGATGQELIADGMGRLPEPATSFRLTDGILAGRASASAVLTAVGALRIGPDALCDPANRGLYCQARDIVCRSVDTMTQPNLDFGGQPCDALSVVLQFEALTAVNAGSRGADPPGTGCTLAFTDDCAGGDAGCP